MSEARSALPIAVLISGGGTTLKNLLERQTAGELPISTRLVVSSKAGAAGLDYARQAGIPTHTVSRRQCASAHEHCQQVFALCRQHEVQLVVMGGYLEHLLIPEDFENRVVNIHPSLIPAFSGQGYYGLRVHRAVLDYGVKVSGCTVHFVDNEFDHGPIIAQRVCSVRSDDTAESLQARVFAEECELYPQAIAAIAQGRVQVQDRRVFVDERNSVRR